MKDIHRREDRMSIIKKSIEISNTTTLLRKGKVRVGSVHMKTYGGMVVKVHALTLALDGDACVLHILPA
jgi:hypothetical protein